MSKGLALGSALLGIAIGSAATAAPANEANLIKGFASYQASRIEDLILDEFVSRLAQGRYFRQFFPDTSAAMVGYDSISGRRLIPLMRHYFRIDLERLQLLTKCFEDVGTKLHGEEADILAALEKLDTLLRLGQKDPPAVDTLMKNGCPTVSPKGRSFVKLYEELKAALKAASAERAGADGAKALKTLESVAAGVPPDGNDRVAGQMPATKPSFLIPLIKLETERSQWFLSAWFGINEDFDVVYNKLSEESRSLLHDIDFQRLADVFAALTCKNETKCAPPAVLVHHLISTLDALGLSAKDHLGFQKFRSASIFLAKLDSIADSGTSEQVRDAIAEFVDDEKAYRDKRTETAVYVNRRGQQPNYLCTLCPQKLFLGSYFGAAAMYVDEDGDGDDEWRARAYGPVGVELKLVSWRGYPIAVGAAPFDIGGYITNELSGEDYEAKLEDIKAPSYYLSIGLKHRPIAFIVGFQEGSRLVEGREEEFIFGAMTFDLPVFTIY